MIESLPPQDPYSSGAVAKGTWAQAICQTPIAPGHYVGIHSVPEWGPVGYIVFVYNTTDGEKLELSLSEADFWEGRCGADRVYEWLASLRAYEQILTLREVQVARLEADRIKRRTMNLWAT